MAGVCGSTSKASAPKCGGAQGPQKAQSCQKKKQVDPEKEMVKRLAKEIMALPPEQQEAKLAELQQQNPRLAQKVEARIEKLEGQAAGGCQGGAATTCGAGPKCSGLDPSAILQACKGVGTQLQAQA